MWFRWRDFSTTQMVTSERHHGACSLLPGGLEATEVLNNKARA